MGGEARMSGFLWKRAVIVGASSGIGEALARQLLDAGVKVACVSRRGTAPDGAMSVAHDVKDVDAVPALFEKLCAELGGLDLIVYASGVMPRLQNDEYDMDKDAETIAVNITGAVAWLNEAARRFGKAGGGTIVGISSVAGERGRRGMPVYGASKAFLNTYLESLRNRVGRRGVHVVTIKPGPIETPMTTGLKMPFMIPAEQAAREILDAARDGQREAFVPAKWKPIMTVIRAIPSAIFRRLNI